MAIGTTTALLIGAAVAAVGTTATIVQQKKAEKAAESQANEAAKAAEEALKAANAKALMQEETGDVELASETSLEEADILRRSKKNRLRVGLTGASGTASVGTGLSVG